MEFYRFKLTAANRKADIDFNILESSHHIFTKAAENCNSGVTFKRDGKKIIVGQITSNYILLTLSSVSTLPSPTRTLSAYSRELFRLEKDNSLLDPLVYNHSLFNTELLETQKSAEKSIENITSPELLKAIIDLLYSPSNDYNTKQKREAISKLKEIMLPFMGQNSF